MPALRPRAFNGMTRLGNFIWSSMQTILSYQLFLQGNMLFIFLQAFSALKIESTFCNWFWTPYHYSHIVSSWWGIGVLIELAFSFYDLYSTGHLVSVYDIALGKVYSSTRCNSSYLEMVPQCIGPQHFHIQFLRQHQFLIHQPHFLNVYSIFCF